VRHAAERVCRWHRVADLPRVQAFLDGLLQREPPLASYHRSYRGLHAARFAIGAAEAPTGGVLEWDYAGFLAQQQRFILRLGRFLGQALRRRWAVIVYIE